MKVIVAGIPRCGTTYLWRCLSGHDAIDIAHSYSGTVIKTHSYAPLHLIGFRAIFMFGDIVNAVISTQLHAITLPHFINCGIFDIENADIYSKDLLNYEKMFDSWNRYNGYPVLMLRYETCWQYRELISDFLEQEITLLPFIERSTKQNCIQPDLIDKTKHTYKELIEKVNKMPDYKLIYRWRDDPWKYLFDKINQYEISEG